MSLNAMTIMGFDYSTGPIILKVQCPILSDDLI